MVEQHNNEEEPIFNEDSMDISDQIGRALEKYTPLLLKKLNDTMEGAMNNHIVQMIREEVAINVQREFEKRDGKGKDKKNDEERMLNTILSGILENDHLLKEQFYLKLRKNLKEKINSRQIESFSMLADVARDHEIEQSRVDEGDLKRKHEDSNPPNKRFKQEGSSGNNFARRNIPFCRQCKKNHSGVCRATENGSYNCGKPGHVSRDCKSKPYKPILCFKCFEEGHMKSSCPKLTEEERLQEKRKEAKRKGKEKCPSSWEPTGKIFSTHSGAS
uniref:uncharacterized protein LOC122587783 n=1 Tax=Erigeron canadensis TaxID=72917 RepID=UPI001CB952C1|nr:uncharacterized protein LOC122587783 [Erigeron canadensis]